MNHMICRLVALCLCLLHTQVSATYSLKNGKVSNVKYEATMPVEGHFNAAMTAQKNQDFRNSIKHFEILIHNFPDSTYADESQYFLALEYYKLGRLDRANKHFANYMLSSKHTKYFEKAITYRLAIADLYAGGWKKNLFDMPTMPKILSAFDDAIEIYDEVIMVLPNHEMAAKALFSKASLELAMHDYNASNETLQTLLRRFQVSEYTTKAYVLLSELYLTQTKLESHNQDLLDLARINQRHFLEKFPRHEDHALIATSISDMEDIYSQRLYETGQFYERTQRPQSSVIYYSQLLQEFPNSKVAKLSKERLQVLNEYAIQLGLNK